MQPNDSENKAFDYLVNVFRRSFDDVRVLRNVLMRLPPTKGVPSAEFDTIVVCNAGVFCFEIKNWKDCTVIREKLPSGQSQWFLENFDNHRTRVVDPVAQGAIKVKALKDYFESKLLVRYYVFLPALTVRLSHNLPPSVISSQELSYVARLCRNQSKSKTAPPLLTTSDVEDTATLISRLADGITMEQHIAGCCEFEASRKLAQQSVKAEVSTAEIA